MDAHLLTLNAGSSSIKFALFDAHADHGSSQQRAEWVGEADGLGPGLKAHLRVHDRNGALLHDAPLAGPQATHAGAMAALLAWRAQRADDTHIAGVGHRIVHGGVNFAQPVRVTEAVLANLVALEPLAPLHQPQGIAGVRAAIAAFPGVPQVACFDTAFHAAQPAVNRRFAIPQALHDAGVRRYGFHGLSYESIAAQFDTLDPVLARGKVVVAHLGNGASLCAIDAGRSVATTMTFSPLDGLTMGTRCGHIDAAAVLYLMQTLRMTIEQVTTLLSRESGLLGLSGVSSDMRALRSSSAPPAARAIDHFVEQVVQQFGAMAAALRGLDAVVFTGGIGEHDSALRQRILGDLAWLGLGADAVHADGPRLTTGDSRVGAWVLHADEEAVIARHTSGVLGLGG